MHIGPLSYDIGALPFRLNTLFGAAGSGAQTQRPSANSRTFRRSVTLQAKAALDRAACALRFALCATPSATAWIRIASEVAEAREQWEELGWDEAPAHYHQEPPDLQAPSLRRTRSHGCSFLHLSFESGYEPHAAEPGRARWLDYEDNRTGHAWVFRHRGRPRPWLMCIHGYGMGIPFIDIEAFRVGWLYEELGLNVVVPVLPLHGPRRIGRQSGDGFVDGDALDTIHAEAQAVWDLRRILSWVRGQGSTAVGVYGLSLGGYNAALLAALDPDLACVIAGMPASDFVRLGQLHSPPGMLLLAQQAGLKWDDVSRIARVISPLALPPQVPHERRYIFAGLADCIVPPDHVRDLWKHWGRPTVTWYDGSHLSFHWEATVRTLLQDAITTTLLEQNGSAARVAAAA